MTIEQIARSQWEKKQERRARRVAERATAQNDDEPPF